MQFRSIPDYPCHRKRCGLPRHNGCVRFFAASGGGLLHRQVAFLCAPKMSDFNPCLDCGICCTHFRISFYWAEADDAPGGFVPSHMTEKLTPHLRCMKGSNDVPRRCSALVGEIGHQVACSIYEQRPSPCREFPVYLDGGVPNPKCNELRAGVGLPPLPSMELTPLAA